MLDGELELYEAKRTLHNKYWMPIQWAMCIITDARHNQQISSDVLMWQLLLVGVFNFCNGLAQRFGTSLVEKKLKTAHIVHVDEKRA